MNTQTALGYIRVSSADQESSLEVQKTRIQEYCDYKKLHLTNFFIDEDVSGFTKFEKRPAGQLAIQSLLKKEANTIVVTKPDRPFRNVSDALLTTEKWNKAKINLDIIDLGGASFTTQTAIGKLMFTMMIAFAEFERNITGERIKDVLSHKRKSGNAHCAKILGFDKIQVPASNNRGHDLQLIPNPQEMAIVQKIFRLQKNGTKADTIADLLNKSGTLTKTGKNFLPSTIRYILKNPIYKDVTLTS